MRDIVEAFRYPRRFARCRFACATGTAVSHGFQTPHGFQMGRIASDAPHRRATRSWPKTLRNRLYGSLSTLLGISQYASGEDRLPETVRVCDTGLMTNHKDSFQV